MPRPLIFGLWVHAVFLKTPLGCREHLPSLLRKSQPKGKGGWGLRSWKGCALDSFLPGLSQAGTHAQGFHWCRLCGPPKDPNFPPHLRPSPGPSTAPKLPSAVLDRGRGQRLPGEGLLGSRLASAVGARHPVARPGRIAGGDGWRQVWREESDLWGQGSSRSIWAGQVRGNQYFR